MTTDSAFAALLGTGVGLGLIFMVIGARRRVEDLSSPGRFSQINWERLALRLIIAVVCAVVIGFLTRWPVGAVLAALSAWWLPRMLGRDHEHAKAVARIEAIASWTESMRDTLAAAAGLEQTILATAAVAPGPIATEVADLAQRLESGQRLPAALRDFANQLSDPTADLVVAALLLAAEQQARDLGQLLGRLASSAREQAGMRLRIAASRARVRASVRIILVSTVVLALGLFVWSRDYLRPYDTPFGQVMLLGAGLCFACAFAWLLQISRIQEPGRVLTRLSEGAER